MIDVAPYVINEHTHTHLQLITIIAWTSEYISILHTHIGQVTFTVNIKNMSEHTKSMHRYDVFFQSDISPFSAQSWLANQQRTTFYLTERWQKTAIFYCMD